MTKKLTSSIIPVTANAAKLLKLTLSYRSTDTHRTLSNSPDSYNLGYLMIDKDKMIATDGIQMMIMPLPLELKNVFEDGMYAVSKVHTGGGFVSFEKSDSKPIPYQTILNSGNGEEATPIFSLNIKFLKELITISDSTKPTVFTTHGEGKLITIKGHIKLTKMLSHPYTAVIMPMYNSDQQL